MSKGKASKPRKVESSAEREQVLWLADELETGNSLSVDATAKVLRIFTQATKGFIGQRVETEYRKHAVLQIALRNGRATDAQRKDAALLLRMWVAALPDNKRGRPKTVDEKKAAAVAVLYRRGDRARARDIGGFNFDATSLAFFDCWKSGRRDRAQNVVKEQSKVPLTPSQSRTKRRAASRMKDVAGWIYDTTGERNAPLEWLRQELVGGQPIAIESIRARATAAGHAWRTIQNAAAEIGVARHRARPRQGEKSTWQMRAE